MDIDLIARAVAQRLFVEVEASGRHVHVTKEQALALFGHDLTPVRELSQPGQYLAKERVTVVGPKGELRNVAVLWASILRFVSAAGWRVPPVRCWWEVMDRLR